MTQEVIKIREDKSKVQIKVTVFMGPSWNMNYNVNVWFLPKGKRKWENVIDTDNYQYRISPDRPKYILEKQLEYCTAEEILEVKLLVWESMKPSLVNS